MKTSALMIRRSKHILLYQQYKFFKRSYRKKQARQRTIKNQSSDGSPFSALIILSQTGHSLDSSVPSSHFLNMMLEFQHTGHMV